MPIYNKKPMPLRKGIGFCQQSGEKIYSFLFFLFKKKGESIIMTHQEIGIYEINRISYLGKGYMYWVDTCLFLSIE